MPLEYYYWYLFSCYLDLIAPVTLSLRVERFAMNPPHRISELVHSFTHVTESSALSNYENLYLAYLGRQKSSKSERATGDIQKSITAVRDLVGH